MRASAEEATDGLCHSVVVMFTVALRVVFIAYLAYYAFFHKPAAAAAPAGSEDAFIKAMTIGYYALRLLTALVEQHGV